jgi:hypothetical protein
MDDMTNQSKSERTKNLLQVLHHRVGDTPQTTNPTEATSDLSPAATIAQEPPLAPERRVPATTARKRKGGRDQHFWLHDDDRRLIRELAGWIGVQGERASDSLVVRAALRTARTGDTFLHAYRQAAKLDARFQPRKPESK